MTSMLRALYIMNPVEWPRIYPPPVQSELAGVLEVLGPVLTPEGAISQPDLLAQADVLFSGWGGPRLDERFLALTPKLKAFFYGAGAVGHLLSTASAERELVVTTANSVNAIPVAEFTLAHILLGLKRAWTQAAEAKKRRAFPLPQLPVPGAYHSKVGLISLSTIGRLVRQRLESFDLQVLAYDPTVEKPEAARINVHLTSLDDLFAESDIVSLHAPLIPETVGLVTGAHLARMKYGATFINTARGSIVRETEMIDVLRARPDLTAVLDVTDPEPPLSTCALFDLPNVVLTPHIAGSLDAECGRMGQFMAEEVRRYLNGQPLLGLVSAVGRASN